MLRYFVPAKQLHLSARLPKHSITNCDVVKRGNLTIDLSTGENGSGENGNNCQDVEGKIFAPGLSRIVQTLWPATYALFSFCL